mmetsp:Transcript_39997/g.29505  ORF Transcript_39997/g.29505 Transcript_39997/m.29505 type:complete len:119 (+) Transcript_39997:321-677(+)
MTSKSFQTNNIFLRVSEANYEESYMPWASKIVKKFVEIGDFYTVNMERDESIDPFCRITLKRDDFSTIYQKSLYSLTHYLSEVGGLFNTFFAAGKLVTFLIMESLILSKIISKLFKYD